MTRRELIAARLATLGFRFAEPDERGWILRLLIDGEIVSVWATEAT